MLWLVAMGEGESLLLLLGANLVIHPGVSQTLLWSFGSFMKKGPKFVRSEFFLPITCTEIRTSDIGNV